MATCSRTLYLWVIVRVGINMEKYFFSSDNLSLNSLIARHDFSDTSFGGDSKNTVSNNRVFTLPTMLQKT